MTPIEQLKSVLYDSEGKCCIIGSDEDRATVDRALQALAAPVQPVGDDWTPCMKLPVVVHVRQQRPGELHVSTREGITPVKPDDLIMRGVSGEEYPISRKIFEQTYTIDTTPPVAQPAPVQPQVRTGGCLRVGVCASEGHKIQAQRQSARSAWVGLTDGDKLHIEIMGGKSDVILAEMVEAKLKEKNT